MAEWERVRLGDIARTNSASFDNKENWSYVNYLDTGNITQNVIADIQYIDLNVEKLPSRAKRKVKKNSIIYSTVRPNQRHYGIIKSQPENFLVSTGFAVIDVDEMKVDADYIFFFLSQDSVVEGLHSIAEQSTSAYPSIKASDIENVEIDLSPISIQKKISSLLKSITEKMAQNMEINDNLQQQATALFDNIYNQAGAEVGFTDVIQILGGGTPKTGEISYWDGRIPFFTPKDAGSPYTLSTEKSITEEGLSHCNSRLYPVNTVFVTARGTVGKVGMPGVPMAMNQSCYALVGKSIHQLLVYFYTLKVVDRLKHKASGAVFDAITTRDFESESVFNLSDAECEAFLHTAEPLYQTILNNTIENQRLGMLRDTLLPKLMSGELDVSDVTL